MEIGRETSFPDDPIPLLCPETGAEVLVDVLEELAGLVVLSHELLATVEVNVVREALTLLAHLKRTIHFKQ